MENRQIIPFGARVVARQERNRQQEMDSFLRDRHIPDSVFERNGSTNREDPKVNNHCPLCGYHPPIPVVQGYIRQECKCERLARYDRSRIAGMLETRQKDEAERKLREADEASSDACYTWLGEDYSEYGLEDLTFENYQTRIIRIENGKQVIVDPANEKLREYALMRAMAFAKDPTGVFILHGGYGLGKTHLACAILNFWRALMRAGLFTTGANLFNALLAEQDIIQRQKTIARLYTTPLMALDDPDHAAATEFRVNTYKEIFNKRTNRGLPTIITTNTPIKRDAMELQEVFGGAAASRLNKGLILVGLRGEDYRKLQIG